MPQYLVVHAPREDVDPNEVQAPTRMVDLARQAGAEDANPRWIATYDTDMSDERTFTLWETDDPAAILEALTNYGFLSHMEARPIRIETWGPADVLAVRGLPLTSRTLPARQSTVNWADQPRG